MPRPYLDGIEFHYYDDGDALAADYAAGRLDAVSGVDPAVAADIAEPGDSRLLRYPGSTLTAVLFNLRPGHPAFASSAARVGLLRAIDREALIDEAYGGSGIRADSLIPTSSPLFSGKASPAVPYDLDAAGKALRKAGWKRVDGQWHLRGEKKPLTLELLSPDKDSNPAAYAAAAAVARDWNAFGISVNHTALPAAEFVGERLMRRDFDVAVGDIAIGLDPDLYPLARLDADRERRLERHRRPGSDARPAAGNAPASPAPRRSGRRPTPSSRSISRRTYTCSRWPSRTRRRWSMTWSPDRSSARFRTPVTDFGMC